MKNILIYFYVLFFAIVKVSAYDFYAYNNEGVKIYYLYINGGLDVAVINSGFYGNDYRGKVIIPEEVTYDGKVLVVRQIGKHAFFESSVNSVSIPKSVESIEEYAFADCKRLEEISIAEGVFRIENFAFENCLKLKSITIPNSVISIGDRVFKNCADLNSIRISNSLSIIGIELFSGCKSLKSIEIPNSVQEIRYDAFRGCTNLEDVKIPNSVKNIWGGLFEGCTNLKKIEIPNSVRELGSQTFKNCTALTDVILPVERAIDINTELFSGCTNLTNINITYVICGRIYKRAFQNCRSLTTITLPYVHTVDDCAFEYATNLTSVVIGYKNDNEYSNPRTFGNRSFYCEKLMSVVCLINYPCDIKGITDKDCTFHPNTYNNGTLYVPQGSINRYRKTTGWKDFKNIVEVDPTTIKVVEKSKDEFYPIFDLNGRLIEQPNKGVNIINGKKYLVK